MQVLKLYDPARKPTEWTGLVHAGQFAVFHSDVATDVERSPDGHYLQSGEDSVCIVFDSLAEAETYCETKVDGIPNLRCDIYDHTGKSKPPMLTYVNKIRLKAGSKRAKWGWALVAASLPFFWIEHHWGKHSCGAHGDRREFGLCWAEACLLGQRRIGKAAGRQGETISREFTRINANKISSQRSIPVFSR